MKNFQEMLRKITSSPHHNQMMRYAAPLNDHFGINHLWYYKITNTGCYSYLGTHSAWSEFCFDASMVSSFPCLRHPNTLKSGIHLMKAAEDSGYQNVVKTAWEKFHVNFNINLIQKVPEGIEAFGFATRFNDCHADERLLNELPLLCHFTKEFRKNHKKLFQLLDDNQVNLTSEFGNVFYERPKDLAFSGSRDEFLRKMGLESMLKLTPREFDVLKYLAHGYPASYIANELQLSPRTIENYIVTIKCKLTCFSKVELIKKAREIVAIGQRT